MAAVRGNATGELDRPSLSAPGARLGAKVVVSLVVLALAAFAATVHGAPRMRGFHVAGAYKYENQALGAPTEEWFNFLQSTGVDWVGVGIDIFSDNLQDPTVYARPRAAGEPWVFEQSRTFSDEQLIGFTQASHARGIRVYWTLSFQQPVYDPGLGDPRFAPNPRNCGTLQYNVPRYQFGQPNAPDDNRCIPSGTWWWHPGHPQHAGKTAQFFSSMQALAVRYAKLAQSLGVEMYSLGTETEFLWRTRATNAPSHFRSQLQNLVDAVRAEYTGLLTYDQHISAVRFKGNFGYAGYIPVFADLGLDVVGVSQYDNVVTSQPQRVLSVAELKAGWLNIFNNEIAEMKTANGGRPVVFTEFGLCNGINGPWVHNKDLGNPTTDDVNGNGVFDGDEQLSNTLIAFAQAVDSMDGLVAGGFLWGQTVFYSPPSARPSVDFEIYGRPQATALGGEYQRWGRTWPRFPGPRSPGTGTISANPYGPLAVTGGALVGNTISNLQSNAVIQLGALSGSPGSFVQIDLQGLDLGSASSLTIRSGAPGQSVLLVDKRGARSEIDGHLQAAGANGAPPPSLEISNPHGITVYPSGVIGAPGGLAMDALAGSWDTGESLDIRGTVDGGANLQLRGARVNGGGAFKGNAILLATFGNANNPVNGAFYLQNGLQLYPSTGNAIALTLNGFGTAKQVFNVFANANATAWMPSAWPAGVDLPPNNAVVMPGGTRAPGMSEPGFGGGSMILQTSGSLTLVNGGTNDFVFPGAIVLKAGGDLNLNGVAVDQGWTTSGQAFQGIFFESPNIVSPNGLIHVYGNDLNWMNFSTKPKQYVRAFSLKSNADTSASFVPTDTTTPHQNTFSVIQSTAAAGGCWTCQINTQPLNVYGP